MAVKQARRFGATLFLNCSPKIRCRIFPLAGMLLMEMAIGFPNEQVT
jgi:hypothetical protein